MKFIQLGAMTAMLAGFAFLGCSSSPEDSGVHAEGTGSIGFNLLAPQGVSISTVSYDLNTQAGADVLSGPIPVPNDNSTINGTLDALPAPGDYSLVLSATGTYNGQNVDCVSSARTFSLTSSQKLTLTPAIDLVCTITVPVPDDTASVSITGNVTINQVQVVQKIVESFGVAPNHIVGVPGSGGSCSYPPIALTIAASTTNPVAYQWSVQGGGTFSFSNAAQTSGTYQAASDGTKIIRLTATLGGVTAYREVTVEVGPSTCTPTDPVCGNGIVEPGEECDDGAPSATCSGTCTIIVPVGGAGGVAGSAGTAGTPSEGGGGTGGTAGSGEGGTTAGTAGEAGTAGTSGGGSGGFPVACQTCLDDPATVSNILQTTSCLVEGFQEGCLAVEQCVVESNCFLPIAAACYCGPDIEACVNPAFVPVGPCATVIRNNFGAADPSTLTNQDILGQLFSFTHPAGVGMSIIDETTRDCPGACVSAP